MEIKFKSFSSGSCGNCYLLGIKSEEAHGLDCAILIDAGVSLRRVKMEMEHEGYSMDSVKGILISHDHWDHIRSLGSYCKKVRIPILASKFLHKAMSHHPGTGEFLKLYRQDLEEGWNEIIPGKIRVRNFVVPHDASETSGFAILIGGHKYVHITDCGRMTEEALNWCRQADTLVIESNYDNDMLRNGPYPIDLQNRIRDGHGHMSNSECAQVLKDCAHDGLRKIFLCHLSEHNNTPELALEENLKAVAESYPEENRPKVIPLPRQTASPLFTL